MEPRVKGKVALVTGSSRVIGRGIALAFANEGCDLLLTGLRRRASSAGATRRGDFFALSDADVETGNGGTFAPRSRGAESRKKSARAVLPGVETV